MVIKMPKWRNGRPAYRQAGAHVCTGIGMEYYIYAIKSCLKNYIYVGLTNDIGRRFNEHNLGKEKTTKFYKPFILFNVEIVENRQEARKIEKYFKSGYGKEILREISGSLKQVDSG